MCGILFTVNFEGCEDKYGFIAARGPDSIRDFNLTLGNEIRIAGASSVLHLRGPVTVAQPLQSSRFLLQWNGEIFDYLADPDSEKDERFDIECNDTEFLFNRIISRCEGTDDNDLSSALSALLAKVRGPWAFVLLDKLHQRVYFGRDCFGRRSLVYSQNNTSLLIASCAVGTEQVVEASAGVLYCKDISTTSSSPLLELSIPNTNNWLINSSFPITDSKALISRAWTQFESSVAKRILHLPAEKGISILFSGGVDSLLIAVACGRILLKRDESLGNKPTPVSLINVAFEHPGLLKQLNLSSPTPAYWSSIPDRQTGVEAFQELCRLFPTCSFSFLECNVCRQEYDESRERIKHLMLPNDTVMDLSLGMVIWHGSQRASKIEFATSDSNKASSLPPYTSTAVLLCGMGADEQLGGYSRHRSLHHDHSALRSELQLDLDRISNRNLGRDDRCIGDAGLEGRFPFLDEQFVSFVCSQVPLEAKLDKWLVREMLREAGVCDSVAERPKKAMQFGAKSAKIESSQCVGTDKLN